MLRCTFHILSSLSALLLAATLFFYIRGHWTNDTLAAGYWHYTPHKGYPHIRDARQLDLIHRDGRTLLFFHYRQCVCTETHWRWGPGPNGQRWVWTHGPIDSLPTIPRMWNSMDPPPTPTGLTYATSSPGKVFFYRAAYIPDYLPTLAFSLLPTLWLITLPRRLRHRPRPGHCPTCNYDLRATPRQCPECGRKIAHVAPA